MKRKGHDDFDKTPGITTGSSASWHGCSDSTASPRTSHSSPASGDSLAPRPGKRKHAVISTGSTRSAQTASKPAAITNVQGSYANRTSEIRPDGVTKRMRTKKTSRPNSDKTVKLPKSTKGARPKAQAEAKVKAKAKAERKAKARVEAVFHPYGRETALSTSDCDDYVNRMPDDVAEAASEMLEEWLWNEDSDDTYIKRVDRYGGDIADAFPGGGTPKYAQLLADEAGK